MAGKFLLAALAVMAVFQTTTAATYTVRDNLGWGVPTGGAAEYENWAAGITFRVDDILVFNFGTGAHDVARVTMENFDSCNSNVPITLLTVGPATVTLNSAGQYNFICTFGNHCNNGQKLSINVTTASSSPPPVSVTPPSSPTPSPPSTTPSPPSNVIPPPSSTTPPPPSNVIPPPPPPPPSSAPRSMAVFGFVCTLLAIAVCGLAIM